MTEKCNHFVGEKCCDLSKEIKKVGENTGGDTLWCSICGTVLFSDYSPDKGVFISEIKKIQKKE